MFNKNMLKIIYISFVASNIKMQFICIQVLIWVNMSRMVNRWNVNLFTNLNVASLLLNLYPCEITPDIVPFSFSFPLSI